MRRFILNHPRLGDVIITPKPRITRFIARWKSGQINLSVPPGTPENEIVSVLDRMADRLLARSPERFDIKPGMRLDFDGISIAFELGTKAGYISARSEKLPDDTPCPVILLDPASTPDNPATEQALAKILRNVASSFAPSILLPLARRISADLGVAPKEWLTGSGSKRLGCCRSDGTISLSSFCLFLPKELRRYVICHELAHLTHFNHSPEFHALCSSYCGGNGNALRAALKAYKWPVPRP